MLTDEQLDGEIALLDGALLRLEQAIEHVDWVRGGIGKAVKVRKDQAVARTTYRHAALAIRSADVQLRRVRRWFKSLERTRRNERAWRLSDRKRP